MSPRVVGAFLVGSALVLTAYTFSDFGKKNNARNSGTDPRVAVVTAQAPERNYIPVADSNNDGIPDWQEILDGTEPIALDPATVDYEEPSTLTDQFARTFFEGYVRDKGYGEFGSSPEEIVANTSVNLQNQALDRLYTFDDIVIGTGNTVEDLKQYGNAIALVNLQNRIPVSTRNEIDIVDEAVASSNADVLQELDVIIESYTNIHDGVKNSAVPPRIAKEHLDYLNALNAVRNDITGMKQAFTDPLYALLRVKRYQDDVAGFYQTILNLQNAILDAGVVYSPDDPAVQVIINQ